ncbi:thiaminase II [Vibrio sp. TH_r3]|uniref:thiaminase II n=1 Tax=Vibrio sp. TH_r3 TaxID=3082084 RepID=UPI002952DAE0|nr:thiaminase II [Vibrio sp. TH_r3]MDV7104768.1 thiaminase II [Vibrio sp. TH_r3]
MNYNDLINACKQEWQTYTEHEFVQQLALGKLNNSAYLHYLKQDFLFLKQYARAYAMAIYKAKTLSEMRMALPTVQALLSTEISHHLTYCQQWGLSEHDMEAEPEAFGTIAYTRYVLDTGMSGDLVDLYTALAPCALGYAEIGRNLLSSTTNNKQNNPYQSWIELYGGEEYQSSINTAGDYLNELLADIAIDSQRGQQLCEVFKTATRMEIAFWQQSLNT